MITRAYRISSSWLYLHSELLRIRKIFTNLQYPAHLIDTTIRDIMKDSIDSVPKIVDPSPSSATISRVVLPFKSTDISKTLRYEFENLNRRLKVDIQPVFISTKVKALIKPPKPLPAADTIVTQSNVVYEYRCSCDMSYIGYTSRYLFQRIAEHRRPSSSIQQHCASNLHEFRESSFKILAKCKSKLDCMIRECHEIYFRSPSLNARDEYICSLLYRLRF